MLQTNIPQPRGCLIKALKHLVLGIGAFGLLSVRVEGAHFWVDEGPARRYILFAFRDSMQ